jgi:hypothetical protein|tara:strand:+ start:709 stop:900 length:192 start_codon:yes stop_codon:yes gene_type:complete
VIIPLLKPTILILIIFMLGFGIYRFGFFNLMKKYPKLKKTFFSFSAILIIFLTLFLYVEISKN